MKTLKANNLDQAKKEIKEVKESYLDDLQSEIKESEKGYFHVLLIRLIPLPNELKNKIEVVPQIYDPQHFEKLKESYKFLGYHKLIVLHDPLYVAPKKQTANTEQKK